MVSRLLGFVVGFILGAAVGLFVTIWLDNWELDPPAGWQTRLIVASIVGGIAAVLGALFGPGGA